LLECFNRRKRAVTGKWHMDETNINVSGQWMHLYRAIDSVDNLSASFTGAVVLHDAALTDAGDCSFNASIRITY
jgi:hypothetical protein